MRFIGSLLFLFFSANALASNLQAMIDAFVHVKCVSGTTQTLLVLENKTPYKLRIDKNGAISDEHINPSNFTIWDMEKFIEAASTHGKVVDEMSSRLNSHRFSMKHGELHFKPFEKKFWIYHGIEKYHKFKKGRDYAISISGLTLTAVHEDNYEETVVLSSNMALIPKECTSGGNH